MGGKRSNLTIALRDCFDRLGDLAMTTKPPLKGGEVDPEMACFGVDNYFTADNSWANFTLGGSMAVSATLLSSLILSLKS